MTCKKSTTVHEKCVAEARNVTASFIGDLAENEVLTGTPTVTASADLARSSIAVNTSEVVDEDKGITIGIGKAVQFSVSGGVIPAGKTKISYEIAITVSTDSTPPQTLKGVIVLKVFP